MLDIDQLREELKEECLGGFFVGGFGGAMVEASDIDMASEEELIKIAKHNGIDLRRYEE